MGRKKKISKKKKVFLFKFLQNQEKKIMSFLFEWYTRRNIRKNLTFKLQKTDKPKLQKEDLFTLNNLMDDKYGVKIFLTTSKYCYDIAKNLKQDVFMVDMQQSTHHLMIRFQENLNIPIEYDLNDIFTKHCFIFVFNLPRSLYLKEFLHCLNEESKSKAMYTLIYCTDLETDAQFLANHFQFIH